MRAIWNKINNLNISQVNKNRLFITSEIVITGITGAFIWLLLGRLILPGVVWLICFVGYPAVFIGFMGSCLYLYNHDFT